MAHDQNCLVLCCQGPEGPKYTLQGRHSTLGLSEPCQVRKWDSLLQVGWNLSVVAPAW